MAFTDVEARQQRQDRLRADIRRLGAQLGDSIRRNVSSEFFELVEQVRTLARSTRDGDTDAGEQLAATVEAAGDIEAILLVRAFTIYFHLANVAEQVHRVEELRLKTEGSGELFDTFGRADAAGVDAEALQEAIDRVEEYRQELDDLAQDAVDRLNDPTPIVKANACDPNGLIDDKVFDEKVITARHRIVKTDSCLMVSLVQFHRPRP